MKLNPLHDRVVVKRSEAETQTSSGLIIPDTAAEKPEQGTVIAVGTGRRNSEGAVIPMTLKENDKVLFGKFGGQTVKIKGEEYVVLREDEIYAVIEE